MAGDAEGNIKQLFSKVQGILKKNGPFEVEILQSILKLLVHTVEVDKALFSVQMLLCVGSFFSSSADCQQQWSDYLSGKETGEKSQNNACMHNYFSEIGNSPRIAFAHILHFVYIQ